MLYALRCAVRRLRYLALPLMRDGVSPARVDRVFET